MYKKEHHHTEQRGACHRAADRGTRRERQVVSVPVMLCCFMAREAVKPRRVNTFSTGQRTVTLGCHGTATPHNPESRCARDCCNGQEPKRRSSQVYQKRQHMPALGSLRLELCDIGLAPGHCRPSESQTLSRLEGYGRVRSSKRLDCMTL